MNSPRNRNIVYPYRGVNEDLKIWKLKVGEQMSVPYRKNLKKCLQNKISNGHTKKQILWVGKKFTIKEIGTTEVIILRYQ